MKDAVNMHMHSHFSFNADGMSPTELVVEAKRRELYAMAILDFDVLDGLAETYAAGERVGMRVSVGLETRTFISEYADVELTSPGEPGIYYQIGMGFGKPPETDTEAGRTLAKLRSLAQNRNREVIDRINTAFPQIAIDYESEVVPLTPSGNPTERHIVLAYVAKVRERAEGRTAREREVWGQVLDLPGEGVSELLSDEKKLLGTVRASLMKRGGAGYAFPDTASFPANDEVIGMILECGAIPMVGWLDGLNEGERDTDAYLDFLRAKGAAAVNIVPDRNWNIADQQLRERKVAKLNEVVGAAEARGMPINVGTELNNYGLPFVDDFEAEPMRPLWPVFFRGAQIVIGHTTLLRHAGFSYCGAEAEAEFGEDIDAKNRFFGMVGALPVLSTDESRRLRESGEDGAYAVIRDSAAAGRWVLPG